MPDEIILPDSLPYTATAESGHHIRQCDYCEEHPRECRRYILRFPEDQEFLDWESGKGTGRRIRSGPNIAYVPTKKKDGTTLDGFFCSEICALKSYFPIYALWRLSGKR